MSPIRLTAVIKELRDGNLLVFCTDMAQRALRVKQIGKCKVVLSSWNDKGAITGVPVIVSTKDARDNLRGGVLVGFQRLQATRGGG